MIALMIASLIFFLSSFIFPRKAMNFYFFLVASILAVIAFFSVPNETMDLYRHYQTLESFRIIGWDAVTDFKYYDSLPMFGLYFYFISLLQLDGFLPAISVFITYFLTFKMIYKVAIKYNVKKRGILLAMLFFVCTFNYFALMSGIRNMLAFSVFAYFLYKDTVDKKHRMLCWAVYIALCFFHSSVAILVLFRVLLFAYNKYTGKVFTIILLAWSFGINLILNVLNSFISIDLFQLLLLQITSYSNSQYYYLRPAIIKLLIIFVIVISFVYFIRNNKGKYNEMTDMFRFIALIIAFTLGSVTNYNLLIRFADFLSILSPIFIVLLLNRDISTEEGRVTFNTISPYTSLIVKLIIFISLFTMAYLYVYQYKYIFFTS